MVHRRAGGVMSSRVAADEGPMHGSLVGRVRTRTLAMAPLLLAMAGIAAPAHAAVSSGQVQALEREGVRDIVVRREPGLDAGERAGVRADAGVTFSRGTRFADTEVVRARPGDLADAVADLRRDPHVAWADPVQPRRVESNDPYWSSLWALENTGQELAGGSHGTPDADMDVPQAWT